MDDFIGIFVVIWIGFSSMTTFYSLGSENATTKTSIIHLCKEAGQFQYGTTVVECKIKGKE